MLTFIITLSLSDSKAKFIIQLRSNLAHGQFLSVITELELEDVCTFTEAVSLSTCKQGRQGLQGVQTARSYTEMQWTHGHCLLQQTKIL